MTDGLSDRLGAATSGTSTWYVRSFDDLRIVPALTRALGDPDPEARHMIERVLRRAGARRPAT